MHARGDLVRLPASDARKIVLVLRGVTGDPLEIVDSGGRTFAATLVVDANGASAALQDELAAPAQPSLTVTLAQGIPKGQKMDFIVEKATELGVARIVPFAAARTVGEGDRAGKTERWRRLAKSAAQQCGRGDVPDVAAPIGFEALLATFSAADRVLVPWELAALEPLRERLPPLLAEAATVLVVIGPEGGFSDDEVRAAERAGAHLVSLGRRILRTETAGLVTLAALRYASGDL